MKHQIALSVAPPLGGNRGSQSASDRCGIGMSLLIESQSPASFDERIAKRTACSLLRAKRRRKPLALSTLHSLFPIGTPLKPIKLAKRSQTFGSY
jgi:hypothetical protein